MRLKKQKDNKTEVIGGRCHISVKNKLQQKANIYTEGNLTEYLIFAGLNFVPGKEDFEDKEK